LLQRRPVTFESAGWFVEFTAQSGFNSDGTPNINACTE